MKAAHSDDLFEMFDLMSQGVWQVDSEGRTTYVNARIVAMLGFSREELRSLPVISFVDEEDRARMRARIGSRAKGVSDNYECQLRHKNGSLVSVSVNSIPLYRDDGEPDGNLALLSDITERKRASEALAREHTFLTEGQALGHLGSWEYVAATGMTYWSDEECRIYGLPPGTSPPYEELLARHIHPEDAPLLDETFREALRTASPFTMEHRIVRPDGGVRVVQDHARPHVDGQGKLLKYTGSTLDITHFRQVEEALRQSEQHLNSALEAAHAAAWQLNLRDKSLRRSVTHDRIFGYDTLVPGWTVETFFEHVLAEDRPAISIRFEEAIASEANWEAGCRIRRADGEIRSIKVMGTTQRDRNGKPVSMSGLVMDITVRKRTEDALQRSEERYRTLTEGFHVGVLIYGPHGEIQLSNPKALELLGLSEDQLLGKTSFDPSWNVIHEDGTPFVSPTLPVPQALATGEPVRHVVIGVQRPTARERVWLLVDAIPTRNPDGAVREVVCSFTDITERKLRDELLHQAQKMESVGLLAGGIAHDFNNMLGVVLAYTELAMEGIAPSLPLYNDLEEVRKAATRSADLTRQLLAFARRQTVVPKVLDLNETLTGMLKMLERLLGENIRIHWRPGPQLWPTKMDPSQVDQILANLCVNARDAIADVGKLTIETENKSLTADDCTDAGATPGDYVRLAVRDNGLGMDRETRARIFEPFFTTKEVGKGTGLGLATVYGIIRQNGGFIDVESEVGRGTTFSLYLPRHFGITDHGAQTAVRPALGGHETILLVEDEPAILKVTKRMLEGLGFQVLAASTAVDAIRLATENRHVHLLLADVIMPDRNGRDLANALLALFPNLKRMFMSGYTADVLAQYGVAEDGLNFIQKPFTKAELAAKIRETLDGTTRTPQAPI